MDSCVVCGGQEFYIEAGYYYCKECQTQHEGKQEEIADFHVDPSTRVRRTRIRKDKSSFSANQISGWTTWEQYNFILIGLANELIALGASVDIKLTLLQLWATYLGKLEVAFMSTNKKTVPKLARRYNRKDAEIIYGITKRKKKKKISRIDSASVSSIAPSSYVSGTSSKAELQKHKKQLMSSEYEKYIKSQNSENDAMSVANQSESSFQSSGSNTSIKAGEKIIFNKYAIEEKKKVKVLSKTVAKLERKKFVEKHVTPAYAGGPQVIRPTSIWALLHLALRINNDKIHLSDMLRYGREGHLSYYKLEHLLPPEVSLNKMEINNLNSSKEISHKGIRRMSAQLGKFLGVGQIPRPNLLSLLDRYITELQLPNGIFIYAERMMAVSPPNMEFNVKSIIFPNYEARVMAFIIVVMKILFGLDGITEYEISRVIERINTIGNERNELESKLFNFREWQRYIECRRCILVQEHFPTKLRRDPHSTGTSHLYVKFMQSIQSKYEGDEPEANNYINLISGDLARMMKNNIERLGDNVPFTKDTVVFPPSLTSQHTYLQKLLDDPNKNLPSILRQNFSATKVGYMLKPESLIELAEKCDIELHVVTSSAHFMEKIVQTFEPPLLPKKSAQKSTNDHNKLTRVIAPNIEQSSAIKKIDDPSEYLHRKYPGKIVIDKKKKRIYDKCHNSIKNSENNNCDNFEFDQILPNGKLKISKCDVDSKDEDPISMNVKDDYRFILSNFERQTMLNPIDNPWEKCKKPPVPRMRHNGKFIKTPAAINVVETGEVEDKNSKCQIQEEILLIDDEAQNDDKENNCNNDPVAQRRNSSEHEPTIQESDTDEISILEETIHSRPISNISNNSMASKPETLTLFRPYKHYWLRRCARFYHITPNNFRLLERDFPTNFRWLLHECANIIEMSVEDLYEEVCLVENYYADVLSPNNDPDMCKKYDTSHYRSSLHLTLVKNKWKL